MGETIFQAPLSKDIRGKKLSPNRDIELRVPLTRIMMFLTLGQINGWKKACWVM